MLHRPPVHAPDTVRGAELGVGISRHLQALRQWAMHPTQTAEELTNVKDKKSRGGNPGGEQK